MDLTQFITLYGPLGFGWIAAVYFIRENKELHKKFRDIAESNVRVTMALSEKIKALSDTIKRGFGDV